MISGAARPCLPNSAPCTEPYRTQRSFDVMSIRQKSLSGPGLPTMTWNYHYSENAGGWQGDGTSPLKTTKLGTGRFWEIDVVYTNQNGEHVGTESYTGFGYKRDE